MEESELHPEVEIELKSILPSEITSEAPSYNSWRTTWEPDTLLETPQQEATINKSTLTSVSGSGVAFPSALNAMYRTTPRTPGDVNIVLENLAVSHPLLNRSRASAFDANASVGGARNDVAHAEEGGAAAAAAAASVTASAPAAPGPPLPESWRDVLPYRRDLPQSWREVIDSSLERSESEWQ